MRFNKLDMNLLAALDILLRTRSVTQAADEMFITQSAMSNALGRLRLFFDDPLLLQVGRAMKLSPLAETLQRPIRDIMIRVESATQIRPHFDPLTSTRIFSLVISDYSLNVLGIDLAKRLAEQAPDIQLNMRPQHSHPSQLLDQGEVDLLLLPDFFGSDDDAQQPLLVDDLVVVVAADGPYSKGPMTKDMFCAAHHVVMEPTFGRESFATVAMEAAGLTPKKVLSTFLFSSMPALIRGTDRIGLIQRRVAENAMALGGLAILESPVSFPSIKLSIRWHAHRSSDPGLMWLKDQIVKCAEALTSRAFAKRGVYSF